MRIRSLVAAVAVLSLAPLAAAGDAPKGLWDGYGEGTWVQTKTTSTTEMPGMSLPGQVSESRQTLVKVSDQGWTIKTEMKTGDSWGNAHEMTIPRGMPKMTSEPPKSEDLGSESVTVEGKEYSCKKTRVSVAGTTVTTWANADQGVLKSESQGTGGSTSTMEVTALAKSVKVGDKEIVCREAKNVMKASGSETSAVMLTSDAVPSRTVRMESSTAAGPAKIKSVTELVAYEIK